MHIEILSEKQRGLLSFVSQFKRSFYLVGGTGIALHIGHRESIDFDLFTFSKINKTRVRQKMLQSSWKLNILFEDVDQLHFMMDDVKVTFFQYPYPIEHQVKFDNIITMPTLLSLAAMKAFALGRRAKWKDYVDLYFIIRDFFTVKEIAKEAEKLFGELFSEKLFRQQLAYHKDINYTEEVQFLSGYKVDEQDMKNFLIDVAIKYDE